MEIYAGNVRQIRRIELNWTRRHWATQGNGVGVKKSGSSRPHKNIKGWNQKFFDTFSSQSISLWQFLRFIPFVKKELGRGLWVQFVVLNWNLLNLLMSMDYWGGNFSNHYNGKYGITLSYLCLPAGLTVMGWRWRGVDYGGSSKCTEYLPPLTIMTPEILCIALK